MKENNSRTLGVVVSALLIACAVSIAAPWRPEDGAPHALYQTAQAQQPEPRILPSSVSFIVRFKGQGPIAQAQRLATRGQESEAARQVQLQLGRQGSLQGLCFDRFTLGGAEVVLRSCQDVPAADRAAFQTRWLARLNAMRAVEYADANVAGATNRAPQ